MDTRAILLEALHAQPTDDVGWLALTDWLEENNEADRAELLRLHRRLPKLRPGKARLSVEERIQQLLAGGVRPCVPTRTNSIGLEMALIPPGTFRMGSPVREPQRMDEEVLHTVCITRPFYLGVYPVTQAKFRAVMGRNPSHFDRDEVGDDSLDLDRFPVESVTWTAADRFCKRLSKRPEEAAARRAYRLPSEAEWEYACRAWGSPRFPFHFGPTLEEHQANFRSDFPYPPDAERLTSIEGRERTCPVGLYRPNAFGLFDMHGNVDEWCSDWHDGDYYQRSPRDDPRGPRSGDEHVIRGGSWGGQGEDCRAAVRIGFDTGYASSQIGFRVVMVPLP